MFRSMNTARTGYVVRSKATALRKTRATRRRATSSTRAVVWTNNPNLRTAASHRSLSSSLLCHSPSLLSLSRLPNNFQRRAFHSSGVRLGETIQFNLSDIGEGIAEVEVLQWFVKVGDSISEFDPVCEVQSDKATVEITSRYEGKVTRLYTEEGEIAKVGAPLIDLELSGGASDAAEAKETEAAVAESAEDESSDAGSTANTDGGSGGGDKSQTQTATKVGGKVLATPAVRRIARENNVELEDVPASGKGGRVLKEDILRFLDDGGKSSQQQQQQQQQSSSQSRAPPPGALAEDVVVPIRGVKRIMVQTMTRSTSIPHFGYRDEIVMDKLIETRAQLKAEAERRGTKLSYMPFVLKAASLALTEYPEINAHVNDDCTAVTHRASHNLGVAMDTPNGLIVPNVKNVQNLSVWEIAAELNRMQELGVAGKLSLDDLSGGTLTVSNIGSIGGTYMTPVLFAPEVAIVALGKMQRVPRFDVKDQVVPSTVMKVSWSADHRVVDGATMARFSNMWKNYLENPLSMLGSLR